MVLSDVNGNGKKSAAERWLRQRNGQRSTAVRCIFGPPEKRGHMMVLMRNEAEMDRKRAEFVARYEPVGLTAGERRAFYDGLVRTSSSTSPGTSQQRGHQQNNDHARNTKAADHQHHHNNYHHQQQKNNNGFKKPDDEKK